MNAFIGGSAQLTSLALRSHVARSDAQTRRHTSIRRRRRQERHPARSHHSVPMGDVRNWLRGELPRLLREIESLDLVLPYLKARGVLTDDDCADIRRENGAKASVELCLVRVFRQDASSLYHNFLVSLSLPYPRLYASLYRGMRSQFGEKSVRGTCICTEVCGKDSVRFRRL